MSLLNQDFDSVVISIQTYIFLVVTALKWFFLALACFSFISFMWFDKQLCYRIIATTWFAFVCIHFVAYVEKNIIESIINVQSKSEEKEQNGGN